MTPTPEKSHAWHRHRKTPSQRHWSLLIAIVTVSVATDSVSGTVASSGLFVFDLLRAVAMRMTNAKEASMARNSHEFTFSRLTRKPRMADHRGFVWKMMMMRVIGMSCKL